MSPTGPDAFLYNTTRIEAITPAGTSRGSGFYFAFCRSAEQHVIGLVSNKHVIAGATRGRLTFNLATGLNSGEPARRQFRHVDLDNFEQRWLKHPDPEVDLAVLPVGDYMAELEAVGVHPFLTFFSMPDVADQAYLDGLSAVEDILMIGYPTGLMDSHNNRPIIRRGITATPAYDLFEGRPQFMIDCACFPGSSGSPVVMYSAGPHREKSTGAMIMGAPRLKLLGVLFSGPRWTAQGTIVPAPVPTVAGDLAHTPMMINLGRCIRAAELQWFEDYIRPRMNMPAP